MKYTKREIETSNIISNFISYIRYKDKLQYTYVEIYDAIEDLFELYNYYRNRGVKDGNYNK